MNIIVEKTGHPFSRSGEIELRYGVNWAKVSNNSGQSRPACWHILFRRKVSSTPYS